MALMVLEESILYFSGIPLAESKMAMGLVLGNLERIITMMAMMGTLNNIPVMPQILPQKLRDKMITSGLKLMLLPISLGSKRLPTKNWIDPTNNKTHKPGNNSPNCRQLNMLGKTVPINEPILGI
jgi:hypothetical protein